MANRWINVQVNSEHNETVRFPIQDDNSVLLSTINQVVRGIALLKYKDAHTNQWNTVNFVKIDECFRPGDGDVWHNDLIYIPMFANNPTVPTTTTQPVGRFDTPPVRSRRRCRDYCKLFFFAVFAIQTAIFTGILSAEYGFLSSASSTATMVTKNVLFLSSWVALAIFALHQVREAIVDFIIKCCTK